MDTTASDICMMHDASQSYNLVKRSLELKKLVKLCHSYIIYIYI